MGAGCLGGRVVRTMGIWGGGKSCDSCGVVFAQETPVKELTGSSLGPSAAQTGPAGYRSETPLRPDANATAWAD